MAKFNLRFERYAQEFVVVEVEAESLDCAIQASRELDLDDYEDEWRSDDELTHPRLYGVRDSEDWLAKVKLDFFPCWIDEDLRWQWANPAT